MVELDVACCDAAVVDRCELPPDQGYDALIFDEGIMYGYIDYS